MQIKSLRIKSTPKEKSIVILIHNELSDNEMAIDDVIVCKTVNEAIALVTSPMNEKQKIIFVPIGLLPQAIFHKVQLECVLPPMVEGCNAMTQLEFSGKPFLHGAGNLSYINGPCYSDQLNGAFPETQGMHIAASRALSFKNCESEHANQLTKFLTACLEKSEAIQNYFKSRQEYFLSMRLDLVATGILVADKIGFPLTLNEFHRKKNEGFIPESRS